MTENSQVVLNMISLAPIRYARVVRKHDGPIERLEYSRLPIGGRELYQANAYLSRHLNLDKPRVELFGNCDGTGTHASAMVARHMAISEALERWALHYLAQAGMQHLYGLDLDGTSTGMAAYPGVFDSQARRRAKLEALERYCLIGWWNGDLGGNPFSVGNTGTEALEIDNPLGNERVVVLWKPSIQGFWSYGFGAGLSLREATWKALVEMERAWLVLAQFHGLNPGFEGDDLETLSNLQERRMVYFSLPEGQQKFRERLKRKISPSRKIRLQPIVDAPVKGPWNRYATVWRYLYPMPSWEYLNFESMFFFW